jgi:two-component sensor histidine kinase
MQETEEKADSRSQRFYEAIREVSSALVSTEDLDEMLGLVADNVSRVLLTRWVFFVIFNPDRQVIDYLVLGGDYHKEIDAENFTYAEAMEGLSGWVVRMGRTALSPAHSPDSRESERVRERRIRNHCGSIIVAPLKVKGRVYGTLTAMNHRDGREFDAIDAEQVTVLAEQASSALANRIAADRLQKLSLEKELLLREAYHRIKNNLQLVASLVRIHRTQSVDPQISEVLQVVESRIRSMSEIHASLHESGNRTVVDGQRFLDSLVDGLKEGYCETLEHRQITIDSRIESGSLESQTALHLGLALNEMVTNAIKYAYPCSASGGQIRVRFERGCNADHPGEAVLTVADDGLGMPALEELDRSTSLGTTVIEGMAQNLDARLSLRSEGGTCWELRFPD